MSWGFIIGVSSVSAKQTVQHVNRFRRNLVRKIPGPISWFSAMKDFTVVVFVVVVLEFSFTKSFSSSGWVMQSSPS